jgi:hypothetical protein
MKRKPPSKVIRNLRQEVGFACPVCASPFLTWHHFDPPWRERQHHNPAGMIALCPEHAAHADGGHWTVKQLRQLKRPLNLNERVTAAWPWKPEKAVFMLGNSYYVGERALLGINGRRILGASRYSPPGFNYSTVMLSVSLQDNKGRPVLTLEDNFLSFHSAHLLEVLCPPQARSLEVKSNSGERLKLQHKRLSLQDFIEQVPSSTFNEFDTPETVKPILQLSALDSEGMIPVIEISGDLNSRDVNMKLGRDKFTMLMKSYGNELVNMPGRFYFPHLSSGALIIKHGKREILRFG